jgi:hypothetical protein
MTEQFHQSAITARKPHVTTHCDGMGLQHVSSSHHETIINACRLSSSHSQSVQVLLTSKSIAKSTPGQ